MFDLSQKRVNHLQGIQFYHKVYIDDTPFGVWIFKRGTFENKGERGYVIVFLHFIYYYIWDSFRFDHWIMNGKHDFETRQWSSKVTFYEPEEVKPSSGCQLS
jgi:hypothetical protein